MPQSKNRSSTIVGNTDVSASNSDQAKSLDCASRSLWGNATAGESTTCGVCEPIHGRVLRRWKSVEEQKCCALLLKRRAGAGTLPTLLLPFAQSAVGQKRDGLSANGVIFRQKCVPAANDAEIRAA
jgi:hypothetical protein